MAEGAGAAVEEAVHRYYDLVDTGALEEMLGLFAARCVYERPATRP